MIGIRTIYRVAANVPFAASTDLLTVGLTSPIAVNETQKIRAWVPFTTGATGGIKCQLVTPNSSIGFVTVVYYDTVAPSVDLGIDQVNMPIGDALANAGQHWCLVESTVVNGPNAGTVDLQFAQNSAANTTTILATGMMEVVKM